MSATAFRLSALPEFEPPLLGLPPDADEHADLDDRWCPPPPPALVYQPPAWDEPGPLRDHLRQLMHRVLEILNGRRPVSHLRGSVSGQVFESLLTRSQHCAAAGLHHRLHTLRTCSPAPGKVELCATVLLSVPARSPIVITLAARVEHRRGRWQCTALRPLYPRRTPR